MTMKKSQRVAIVALSAAGVVLMGSGVVSATAYAEHASVPFLSYAEAAEQFPKVARQFEAALPPGVEWPTELPDDVTATAAEGDVAIEPLFLETVAAFHWLCAWERDLLAARDVDDHARSRIAMEQVARFADLEWYAQNYIDPDRIWFSSVAEPALRGDLSGVEADVRGCQ
jgi:hypothetical protein